MSLGYAERLSYREDVGKVGMPELFDTEAEVDAKISELVKLMRESRRTVAFTGAGISTSCGIPDFRGPNGIWTLQREGKPIPKAGLPFGQARPGLTHMALKGLLDADRLHFIISQNVDGLHLRSGVPRELLSELHGNCFRETCDTCSAEYVRDFELECIGLKATGRRCSQRGCRGRLRDSVLDWDDALPPSELRAAEQQCKEADLVLCLGTSLQITPACNLPLKAVRAGGKMVIVNLQGTPKDSKATLVIRARVDQVIGKVMCAMQLRIPPFVRVHRVVLQHAAKATGKDRMAVHLRLESSHGRKAPLPFVTAVEVVFSGAKETEETFRLNQPPFQLRRSLSRRDASTAHVRVLLGEGCMCSEAVLVHVAHFQNGKATKEGNDGKEGVEALDNLVAEAVKTGECGGSCLVYDSGEASEHAIVTGVVAYSEKDVTPPRTGNGIKRQQKESVAVVASSEVDDTPRNGSDVKRQEEEPIAEEASNGFLKMKRSKTS